MDLKAMLDPVSSIAREAGAAIMEIYNSDFAVQQKDDKSPLTAADLAAHQVIEKGLLSLTDYPVLSEESAAIPYAERETWKTYWLVDPLDGTKEFVKRNGEFTVNIALIHENFPILGVVYVPAQNLLYYAADGEGTWRVGDSGDPEQVSCRELDESQLVLASSRSHAGSELGDYLEKLGSHEAKVMGSSLKFCLVADGAADLYPRIGLTSEWDTAAAQCVVEQAGGHVTDTNMQRLPYNTKDSLLNPYFFVFGKTWKDWSVYL